MQATTIYFETEGKVRSEQQVRLSENAYRVKDRTLLDVSILV